MDVLPTLVSVVRDWAMYNRCIATNPCLHAVSRFPLDNTTKGKGIPACYNTFLDQFDFSQSAWLIFCHEDFEIKTPLSDIFPALDVGKLYGPIGVVTKKRFGVFHQWQLQGCITESHKDGTNARLVGHPVPLGTPVETFDCQCVIVHSSLIQRTGIRFDENLSFDLYVEDFCIQAKEHFQVESVILPLPCQHWSGGNVGERYRAQEVYLNTKWSGCCYTGTSSHSIGTPSLLRRMNDGAKAILMKLR